MILLVRPTSHIQGTLRVPGDKSISHRAAIFGALAQGTTRIHGFLRAQDTLGTLRCLRELGVQIEDNGDEITVQGTNGQLKAPTQVLDCGNSGTTTRLLLGVLAGQDFETTIVGDESLSRRPMDRVAIPLQQMGAQISGQGERCAPPVIVQGGHLHSIEYLLPVASAQVKSAILLAGLQAEGVTTVIEPAATRDHTERMLRGMGVEVETEGTKISVRGGQKLSATGVQVPGDISSAAFFLVAAALCPGWEVTIQDVNTNPTRTGVLDVLRAAGAEVVLSNQRESGGEPLAGITIRGQEKKAFQISGALVPRLVDEIPVLALLATQCEGTTIIKDAQELRVKESDRIEVVARELRKLGANIEEQPDGMLVHGPTPLTGTIVTSPRGDHRIAMTLAIAGLVAEGETTIENADAVQSSFPNFAELLEQIRA